MNAYSIVDSFKKEYSYLEPIISPVINNLGGVSDYTLNELFNLRSANDGYGCFIYHDDLRDFYRKNRIVINQFIGESSESLDYETEFDMVASFGCLSSQNSNQKSQLIADIVLTLRGDETDWDISVVDALCWYCLESVAFAFQDFVYENDIELPY